MGISGGMGMSGGIGGMGEWECPVEWDSPVEWEYPVEWECPAELGEWDQAPRPEQARRGITLRAQIPTAPPACKPAGRAPASCLRVSAWGGRRLLHNYYGIKDLVKSKAC